MPLLIVIIIVTLICVAVFALRLFRIEKVETIINKDLPDIYDTADTVATADDSGDEQPEEDQPNLSDMVDVFDYFSEDEQKSEDNENDEHAPKYQGYDDFSATDKLTEFKRGRGFLVDCKRALESAKDQGHIYCVAYFDYDRFSYINSLKGAASGDYVLTQTSQQIRRIFPEGALITRISCDHFIVIFPLVDLALFDEYYNQMRRMGEKIRNDLAAKTGMRICIGFATTDNDSSYDINVLTTRANVARYCAKVTKADKFETYDETMCSSGFYGDTLMEGYAECQYSDEFAIYFETQVDLISDKIKGCDTLVRWSYEDSSGKPITQETGRIPTNNHKVVYQVCRSISRWRKAGREIVPVFAELPVTELFRTDVDDFIGKCLVEFQVDPASLIIKVDAAVVRLDWSSCSRQFKKLREIGIQICVFGMDTGYTNFEFLSGLSVDYVKLHRSFVYNIDTIPEQLEKCRKIIERANTVGATVIFEGVENIDQVTALRSINAKTVQGRYTGRPFTTDELTRNLPEHVETRMSDQTLILDEADFAKGNYDLF